MFVVTGATGFVGSQVIPVLRQHGDVIVISHDPDKALAMFPEVKVRGVDALADLDLTGACVLHLAARNNDRPGEADEFHEANVNFLMQVARAARAGGAARFLNLCSTHALAANASDHYSTSKREGARQLAAFWPEAATNIYVPAIYGQAFRGNLQRLNRLPAVLRPVAITLLHQIRPMIAVDVLMPHLLRLSAVGNDPSDTWATEHYLADPVPDHGLYAAIKRTIDLSLALVILAVAGLVMLLIGIYVRLDSKGPSIFAQTRVGQGSRQFTCYKFRTMRTDTQNLATHEVSAAAVTRAGKFLRRTKLDELPQIFNVIANDMSFVGPRPCLPVQDELIDRRKRRSVLDSKPGITGLAQINDIDMSDPPRLAAWDDRYCVYRSTVGDLAIMVRTLLGRGSGDRVLADVRQDG